MSNCPFCSEPVPMKKPYPEEPRVYGCQNCYNALALNFYGSSFNVQAFESARDIRHVTPDGTIGGDIVKALPKALKNLPVLPEISQRLLIMARDPKVSMAEIAAVIREDQVVAVKVLQLANSPVYRGLQEVKDLNMACVRLGTRTLINTVQAVANGSLYITGDKRLRAFMQSLWRHAVATAHAAAGIALALNMSSAETLFVAGLIHDIGKVVLLDIVTNYYSGSIKELRESLKLFSQVMKRMHPLIGLHVVQQWNLPPEFSATTYCQNQPELSPNEQWLPQIHVIALGNAMACAMGFTAGNVEEMIPLEEHPSALFLHFPKEDLDYLQESLGDTLEALLEVASVGS